MTLGQRLATLRKQNRLTQQKLGEQLNVSAQAVSKWENDQAEPDVATICRLAKIYHVSIDTLLMGQEPLHSYPLDDASTQASPTASTRGGLKRRTLLLLILAAVLCFVTILILFIFAFASSYTLHSSLIHTTSPIDFFNSFIYTH
jgi:transcriptional regulator with XRE-family HTH domain